MNKKFEKLGFYPADILMPKDCDMTKWAVVACDQFTSEPEYWEAVEKQVGDAPSTLRLILPEANLKAPNVDELIENINTSMKKYMDDGVFKTLSDSLIYVEREQSDGKIRHGLVGMVDLDAYDFTPGSGALIRATEATVQDRIPPRARVRRNAPIELPHVMLLIDNPEKTVIEPLTAAADSMEVVYDFDLMQNGGHIKGYKLSDAQIDAVADALAGLCSDEAQMAKYNLSGAAPLLFAVGDGNHSLATAKACYEEQKKGKTPEEYLALPARYALVEVVNNHDDALQFEPIHRVLFGVKPEHLMAELKKFYPDCYEGQGEGHVFAYNYEGKSGFITWVAKDTAEIIGSAGLGWIASFLIVILFYTYSHYCFASVTARISAMYATFVAVAAACGTPALMAALTFGFFANCPISLTHYGNGFGPVYFGAGYVSQGEWWRNGFVICTMNVVIWLTIGMAWWKVIGLY